VVGNVAMIDHPVMKWRGRVHRQQTSVSGTTPAAQVRLKLTEQLVDVHPARLIARDLALQIDLDQLKAYKNRLQRALRRQAGEVNGGQVVG
jgi:hypothetical protein